MQGRYAIVTSPAPLTSEIEFSPALPEAQRDALARLRYGRATKTLLQLDRHPWRRARRPRACATDIELGAIWDGSEEQAGPRAIVTLLAGGNASAATKAILAAGGAEALTQHLDFFGIGKARQIAYHSATWRMIHGHEVGTRSSTPLFRRLPADYWPFPGNACFSPASTRASYGRAT